MLDDGQVLLQTPKQGFLASNFPIIKEILRVPEIFHIGVNICREREQTPDFENGDELFQLIGK